MVGVETDFNWRFPQFVPKTRRNEKKKWVAYKEKKRTWTKSKYLIAKKFFMIQAIVIFSAFLMMDYNVTNVKSWLKIHRNAHIFCALAIGFSMVK